MIVSFSTACPVVLDWFHYYPAGCDLSPGFALTRHYDGYLSDLIIVISIEGVRSFGSAKASDPPLPLSEA